VINLSLPAALQSDVYRTHEEFAPFNCCFAMTVSIAPSDILVLTSRTHSKMSEQIDVPDRHLGRLGARSLVDQ
jgi:hypothetical protein